MNLYLISQNENNGYDTYDSAVVCAETEEKARMIHPYYLKEWDHKRESFNTWSPAKYVKVKLIGEAIPGLSCSVVCASFNAG